VKVNGNHAISPLAMACLLALSLVVTGCAGGVFPVRSAAVTATVVDEETNAPLEGVAVVGKWPNIRGTFAGSSPAGIIEIKEVMTDAQGKFTLPGWWKSGEGIASPGLTSTGPQIYLYKAGYWPRRLQNPSEQYDQVIMWPDAWRSDWDGKTIRLKSMHAENWGKKEWKKFVERSGSTPSVTCSWQKYPRMMIEWERQWVPYKKKFGHKPLGAPNIGYMDRVPKECLSDPISFYKSHGMTQEEIDACCIRPKRREYGKRKLLFKGGKPLIRLESIKIYKEGSRRNEGRNLDDR